MRKFDLIFILLVLFSLSACSPQANNDKLEKALILAGDNREELEKVLNHYSQNESDSLKFKAAEFLIENMPGHYSYAGDEIIQYYNKVDSVLSLTLSADDKATVIESITKEYHDLAYNTIEDVKIISAEYLIDNIESSFDRWKEPWASHLNFDEFCEYLLPYKCWELQRLDQWKEVLATKFDESWDNHPFSDEYERSTYHYTLYTVNDMRIELPLTDIQFQHLPFLCASLFTKTSFGSCTDFAILGTAVLRAKGIPAAIDYIPVWGRVNGSGHCFYSILNNDGKNLPLIWGHAEDPGGPISPLFTTPKVYRYTYQANDRITQYYKDAAYTLNLFNVFQKDVTELYLKTSDLNIPVADAKIKDTYAYIAVFNEGKWRIVDFGMIENGVVHFSNMGRGHVYLVFGYNGDKIVPVGQPFILHANGDVKNISADASSKESVELYRKYPKSNDAASLEQKLIGGKIEASNSSDFSICETVYEIGDLSFPDLIDIRVGRPYRYWRFISAPNEYCTIAELQFYGEDSGNVLRGAAIGPAGVLKDSLENVFDGDWLTSYMSKYRYSWVGLDLGKPMYVSKVRCVPRSDDNNIHYGDMYELRIWDNDRWLFGGRKVGEGKSIIMDSVPKNALLWLRNLTRGKEERIFTYEYGAQVWW